MALVEVPNMGDVEFVKWKEVPVDSEFKGYFLETKESTRYKGSLTHYVQGLDGKVFGLTGNANINRFFAATLQKGMYFELTYKGEIVMASGNFAGKECHQFAMKYDPERFLTGYGAPTGTPVSEVAESPAPAVTASPAAGLPEPVAPTPAVTAPQPVAAGETPKKKSPF